MEETQDASQVLETETTEEATETAEEATAETQVEEEDIEAIKAKAAKADDLEKQNKQLFERAKKAESKTKSSDELSVTDAVVLMQAGVKAEHFKDVVEAAKVLKLSIPEAMKNNVVISILAQKTEEEKTASATQVRTQARGTTKVTGDQVLQKFENGTLPESDAEFTALAEARLFRHKPKARR